MLQHMLQLILAYVATFCKFEINCCTIFTKDYKSLKIAISKAQAELAREEARDKKVWDYCHITGKF
jgi:hypothetical protein